MEPINYAAALWRSWRLLLVLGIVGAVIALLLPLSHVKQQKPVLHYTTYALVGTVPKGGSGLLGGGVTGQQIQFYASSVSTEQDAVKLAGLKIPTSQLPRYMNPVLGYPKLSGSSSTSSSVGKTKATNVNVVTLNTFGTTKTQAENLANDWAAVLNNVLNYNASQHAAAVASAKSSGASAGTARKSGGTTDTTGASSGSGAAPPVVSTGYLILTYAPPARKAPVPGVSKLNSRKIRLPLGFFGGLVAGAVIVLLRMVLDRRLRTGPRAAALFGFPVIAEIPERPPISANERAAPVDVVGQPTSPEAEAFRMLRMSVLFESLAGSASDDDPLAALFGNARGNLGGPVPAVPSLGSSEAMERHVVMVVSPGDETTRPVVAANLAAVCAESGERVIVVGTAELQAGRLVGAPEGAMLTGEIHPADVQSRLEPTRVPNISRLPLSLFLQHSSQLVNRGKGLLDAARGVSDVIIIETPALLTLHHAEALSRSVDVVVVVGECGNTRLGEARKAGDLLRRIGAPVLGVVLSNVRARGGSARHRRRALPRGQSPVLSAVDVVGTGPEPPVDATVSTGKQHASPDNGAGAVRPRRRPGRRRGRALTANGTPEANASARAPELATDGTAPVTEPTPVVTGARPVPGGEASAPTPSGPTGPDAGDRADRSPEVEPPGPARGPATNGSQETTAPTQV